MVNRKVIKQRLPKAGHFIVKEHQGRCSMHVATPESSRANIVEALCADAAYGA